MVILDTGIGLFVFGSPVLLIILTAFVSFIEAFYLKRYNKSFIRRFEKLLIVNFASTIAGIAIILIFNVTDGLRMVAGFAEAFGAKFSFAYSAVLSIVIGVLSYGITVLMEFPLLKIVLWKEIAFKDVVKANLISYLFLLFVWIVFVQTNLI